MAPRDLLLLTLVSLVVVFCESFTSTPSDAARRRCRVHSGIFSIHASNESKCNEDDSTIIPKPILQEVHSRFQKYRSKPYYAPHVERILLLSDLHCDYAENKEWISNLSQMMDTSEVSPKQTMILVAGDVSHDLQILRWTFQSLKNAFAEVAFVPGNHELWLDENADEKDVCADSIHKLERIMQICLDEDIRIGPVKVGSLWIVPLLSWHHLSFDSEPPICSETWARVPTASKTIKVGSDYRKTVWPYPISPLDDSVAQLVDSVNDIILDIDNIDELDDDTTMLTFSHFLPRVELLPEKRYLSLPTLPACSGSTFLENRLRDLHKKLSIRSNGEEIRHVHGFGHSHLAFDLVLDHVRYVHAPLAYPKEWKQRRRSLEIGTMAGDQSRFRFPVTIWEKDINFPPRTLGGWWSTYYKVMPREPHRNKELAPWVAIRFKRRTSAAVVEDFDHVKMEMKYKLQHPSYFNANGTWYAEKETMKSTRNKISHSKDNI